MAYTSEIVILHCLDFSQLAMGAFSLLQACWKNYRRRKRKWNAFTQTLSLDIYKAKETNNNKTTAYAAIQTRYVEERFHREEWMGAVTS